MSESDLISFLQDIWEETGMFNYLRIFYSEGKGIKIETIQNIINYGIESGIFEIYQRQVTNINDFELLDKETAISEVSCTEHWFSEESIYEVLFVNNDKFFEKLFVKRGIPDIFIRFIRD
ncbi:hypothetical protein ERUR111494_04385 [Erysipelothrix urinaevulpis]|uniref:hypothetical protein n=1 Tax=Erysipelothrix urinaevulpis TaxID=2683717 RepID=UPI001357FB03|nr:hypothetical protein [Erysipelothrix urinaevulpis]